MTQMFDPQRFLTAQARDFDRALAEIRAGQKETHWMWYIFPQLLGLGDSPYSVYFGIPGLEGAKAYLSHPILRENLLTITRAVLQWQDTTPWQALPGIDCMKLRSCMTLFEAAAPEEPVFSQVLDRFYWGQRDIETLRRLRDL